MKIAFVMYPGACFIGPGDGIRMQATIWKEALVIRGHEVVCVEPWGYYDWKSFDIVHVFGLGLWNYDFIRWGSKLNPNFVLSPIIDTNTPLWAYKVFSRIGASKLRLFSQNYIMRLLKRDVRLFLARSAYEASYLRTYGMGEQQLRIVPLAYRFNDYNPEIIKEPFCLFAGTMTHQRKNVAALIEAAKKYRFKLVLVGDTGDSVSLARLKAIIGDASNIEIKGFVSEEQLSSFYNRAKVFALPSLNEGVGLVALEAAVCGCDIVITERGGPKEYYDGLAYLVNPQSIDDIGQKVIAALNETSFQPALRSHVTTKYSPENCANQLIDAYASVIDSSVYSTAPTEGGLPLDMP